MSPIIYIIIPVHNRKEFTINCLTALGKQTYNNFNVVIVDDGSADGTSEILSRDFPEVHVIKGDGNLWWTAATNLGIKYALEDNADFILTLNNDTIAAEDFLEKMVYWAKQTPNALLGAFALEAETKNPVYGGEIINWKTASYKSLLDIIPREQWIGLHQVTHFPGRGLLIPKEVFSKIGLYDEKHFPQYFADYDFTHKAIRGGYNVYCNYDAKLMVYPKESGSEYYMRDKNLINYFSHLFSIKGGGNLRTFFFYTIKNCPKKYIIISFTIGFTKRILGYFIHWLIK